MSELIVLCSFVSIIVREGYGTPKYGYFFFSNSICCALLLCEIFERLLPRVQRTIAEVLLMHRPASIETREPAFSNGPLPTSIRQKSRSSFCLEL